MTTGIEWTDETWNPVTGCSKVSQGCKNCYAERIFPRAYSGQKVETKTTDGRLLESRPRRFTDVWTHPDRLDAPLRWRKPRRIFVNSMSDLFHDDVPDAFIDEVFAVMGTAKWHIFQVLTKRPQRMLDWFSEKWQAAPENTQRQQHEIIAKCMAEIGRDAPPFKYNPIGEDRFDQVYEAHNNLDCCTDPRKDHLYTLDGQSNLIAAGWPLPNVWLGVSVEDQATADERIPLLLQTPAAVRFVSYEPALGPVDFGMYLSRTNMPGLNLMPGFKDPLPGIQWVIAGGESGPNARPSHPDWFRSVRDQCAAAGVPFFFKQWGEWLHERALLPYEKLPAGWTSVARDENSPNFDVEVMRRVGKKAAGRLLDGRQHSEYPA